jgi:hypothetical protein
MKSKKTWAEKLQMLHDESCRLGAKCPGQEGKQAVAVRIDAAGVVIDPEYDKIVEQLREIERLLGDFRSAAARQGSQTSLEGPDAGQRKPSVMFAEDIERLAGTQPAWPGTNKSEAPEPVSGRLAPTSEVEKARRERQR